MDTASMEEKQVGHKNSNNPTGENIGQVEKQVQFNENVEMIKERNEQNRIQEKQSSEVKKIGDIEVSSKWIHMDTVEHEKLEWMKDCPPPSALESKVILQTAWRVNKILEERKPIIGSGLVPRFLDRWSCMVIISLRA